MPTIALVRPDSEEKRIRMLNKRSAASKRNEVMAGPSRASGRQLGRKAG